MKKSFYYYTLISFLLLFIIHNINAQVHININSIVVSEIIEKLKTEKINDSTYIEEIFREDFGEGPWIDIDCSIINDTKDPIILYPANAEKQVIFNYKKKQYIKEYLFTIPFFLPDSLLLLPYQSYSFHIETLYLLGCDFYKWNKISLAKISKIDHSKEVLTTLPTLRVRYKDKNIDITTSGIKNVTFTEFPYFYKCNK